MFYELIYTRCRQGIDITQKGRQISSDGYKVYSCSPPIMEEGKVDLPLLVSAAQAKQPCNDPDFMDDAYLYYVPDTGAGFFINFHPIPFDANAKGDFAHRPGNYVNHALVGDFSQVYPYKMFQDEGIWDAQTRDEAYYYENPPADAGLPVRGDITAPGRYKFDEIRAFIADGRQEALKKAVAFLIAQYKEEPEKRKYLVIRDDSSKNIELWIAAIESAFSPRIASAIPFATRMDKFVNTNRYTVKNGIYQQQINLQDPNQKQRYRAMILGVDERDKANAGASRPLASSPFVLLDGKQKQALFEADISNPYYKLIEKFDGEHQKFCVEFLQAFSAVKKPDAGIYELYEISTVLNNQPDAKTLSSALGRLTKYQDQATDPGVLKDIYKRVDAKVSELIQDDFLCALSLINWLQSASKIAGEPGDEERLTKIICDAFVDIIFGKKFDNDTKRSYWKQIQNAKFAPRVAGVITDMEIIEKNSSKLNTPADRAAFVLIYLDCASLIGNIDQQNLKRVIRYVIKVCHRDGDANTMHEIVMSLSRVKINNSQDFLFSLLAKNGEKKDEEKALGEFVIKYIIDRDATLLTSDNSMREFCKKLKDAGLGQLAGSVLMKRADSLNLGKVPEIERFIETIHGMDFIEKEVLAKVFETIDAEVDEKIKDPSDKLLELLQTKKPDGAKCVRSAHYFAFNVLAGSRRTQGLTGELKELMNQGFPSIITKEYIDELAKCLIKANLSPEEQAFILKDLLSHAPKEYFSAYLNKLLSEADKHKDKWAALIKYAFESENKLDDDIVQALVDSDQREKSLAALGNFLADEDHRKYYEDLFGKAKEKTPAQKKKTGLFGW
jgi:hypothetical protein